MRLEESEYIGEIISNIDKQIFPKHCFNIGAGNVMQLTKDKPWIHHYIFEKMIRKNTQIIHTDIFPFPGVDQLVDLSDLECLDFTNQYEGPKLFICTNVLEHLPAPVRETAITAISRNLNQDDHVILSVPYQYPYHPDPIDTLFRPSSEELCQLFDIIWLDHAVIPAGSYLADLKKMRTLKIIRKVIKPLWPFQSMKKYLSHLHRLTYIGRPYLISVAFGKKGVAR